MAPESILAALTQIANGWRGLAFVWHVLLAVLLLKIVAGWRPSSQLLARLLIAPLLSVSLLAWLSGNAFNGSAFAVVAATLLRATTRLSNAPVQLGSRARVASGVAFIVFGWTYPHFLTTNSWTAYLYASPFGLLPCPTLSVVLGITLLVRDCRSSLWTAPLVIAGLLYGAIGVFGLGVPLDWGLLAAAAILAVPPACERTAWRSVGADHSERTRPLPGDDLIPEPLATLTHGITVGCAPEMLWPWLIQMGAGSRAGWYSYDFLDNGRRPSANRLVPEFQGITLGTIFPALPGVTDGFKVLAFEPCRSLVLGWSDPHGKPIVTWAFVLVDRGGATRLIVRARGSQAYRFRGLPSWLSKPSIRFVHYVMQRKQLLGIARRVEPSNAPLQETAPLPPFGRQHI